MNRRNALCSCFLTGFSLPMLALAQGYHFQEVTAGLSLFGSPTIYSVTDKGSLLLEVDPFFGPGSAFVLTGTRLTQVPLNAGDSLVAFNNLGTFLGAGNNGVFLQDSAGKQTLVANPAGYSLVPTNFNNQNVMVGQAVDTSSNSYGYFLNGSAFSTFTYPGGLDTTFIGVSDSGEAVGSYTIDNSSYLGFIYAKGGKTTLIEVPNYTSVFPATINTQGLVVGDAYSNSDTNLGQIGFYRAKSGKVVTFDLGESAPVALPGIKGPLPLLTRLGITNIWGENNLGWICGSYVNSYEDEAMGYAVSIPMLGKPN